MSLWARCEQCGQYQPDPEGNGSAGLHHCPGAGRPHILDAPSTEHRVQWRITPGWGIDGHVFCDADPQEGRCRNYCAIAECEDGCTAPGEHQQTNQPTCNVKDWLESSGQVDDFYKGPKVAPRDGYIRVWWDREGIAWEYDPPQRALTTPEQEAANALTLAHLARVKREQTHGDIERDEPPHRFGGIG